MDKQQLLVEIRQAAAVGIITKEEALAEFSSHSEGDTISKRLSLSDILYYLGGTIVFLGITVMCYQNWDSFSSGLRIFVTLGSALAAYIVGALLYRYENFEKISQAFFLICGLLAALALNVVFKEAGWDINSDGLQVLIFAVLTAVFIGSLWFFRKQSVLLFFGIVFATALFHFVINMMIGQSLLADNYWKIWQYRILAAGLAWMCLGYYLPTTSYKPLSGVMYGFGVLGFLGAAMALGGWQPSQNAFWELVYPLLVFGVIFLSVYIKSKSFLVFGVIFLIGYILKLTGEYFTSGLGWPLALVLAGLVIMGIGYYAVRLNRKYFTNTI